jgi:nitrogen fixation/metabolism regulation signal transduction histidine kinase
MKYIVITGIVLGAFLLYLLSNASPETSASGAYYDLLVTLNVAFGIFLLILIVTQLFWLYKKIKARVVGGRFALRLLASFALMAFVPGLVVYLVSVNFITKSIDSWFNVKVEAALEGGLTLGKTALDILLFGVQTNAENMAESLSLQPADAHSSLLSDLRQKSGIQDVTLLTPDGKIIAVSSGGNSTSFLPLLPTNNQLQEARYRVVSRIVPIENKGLFLRVLVPVSVQSISGESRILQLLQPVPKSLGDTAESVQSVFQDYQKLSYDRQTLGEVFALTLTLVMMFSMLVAMAIAFVLSKKIASPLTVLSEGTRAIASGDYSITLPEHSKDELGVLVKSFNSMTRQLDDATHIASLNREHVEQARGYLETILAYLSSGVIALNGDGELRTFNEAAIEILDVDLNKYIGFNLVEVGLAQARLTSFLNTIMSQNNHTDPKKLDDHVQIELVGQRGKQIITLRGTRLPDGGYVAVFEDSTNMVQVQRDAAWGEVARRLAHEIKNPLTPIQLSAERIAHKLQDKLNEADAGVLNRSVDTIVNQVDAMKKMVNEFSEYARSPAPKLEDVDLNQLVSEVVSLYEGNPDVNKVHLSLSATPSIIKGDLTMLRQVMHNLMQNALDAGKANGTEAAPKLSKNEVSVNTIVDGPNVILTVQDTGCGFPVDLLHHAFEPYMTTKPHGTGLGLAIVKKIIDEHKGHIMIENIKPNADETLLSSSENVPVEALGAIVTIHFPINIS